MSLLSENFDMVRELASAAQARATERDEARGEAMFLNMEMFDHQTDLSEALGMIDEDGMPASWGKIIARVKELRTTLRSRKKSDT